MYVELENGERVYDKYTQKQLNGFGLNPKTGKYDSFALNDKGEKFFVDRDPYQVHQMSNMGLNPETGQYQWYNLADDGTKLWCNNNYFSYVPGAQPSRLDVGKAPDGKYKFFMYADDGSKCWDPYNHGIFPDRLYKDVRIGQADNGVYKYYVVADDGSKVWGETVKS